MPPTHRLAPLALLAMAGCTAMHTHEDTGIRFVTFSDWTAPSVTCVETAPGVWHVLSGSSVVGQLAGPGAIAASGVLIGEGIENGGDEISVEGGSASASQVQGQAQGQIQGQQQGQIQSSGQKGPKR